MKKISLLIILGIGLTLAACASAQPAVISDPGIASAKSQNTSIPTVSNSDDLIRTDEQGAVSFSVQPLNLNSPSETLDFEVSMNTHSVNLNMDVASLATLTTDNGNTAQGIAWEGGSGGHHVSGTLFFPASVDGKSILDGATSLTLTIKNIDAPERVFTWSLNK